MRRAQIEGRHPVLEALRAGRPIDEIIVSDHSRPVKILDDILAVAKRRGVKVRTVPRSAIDERARTPSPQGVIAFAPSFEYRTVDDILDRAIDPALIVALDGVTDPGNVGALARSAHAAGADGLILRERRSAHITAAAQKAAAGALAHLPVAQVKNLPQTVVSLKERGLWIIVLDGDAKDSIYDAELFASPLCLVVGSEGAGVSHLVRKRADLSVRIPMSGKIASLSASAAGAVALFEIARRRT